MRTSIFMNFANRPKEFREDFETLWSLPDEDRAALIPYVSQLSKAETTGEGKAITDKAVSEIGGQSAVLLRSLKLLEYISDEWNPSADTPENFLRDLTELGLVPSTKARKFLFDLLTEVERDNLRRLEKDYANALLPSYVGTYTVVDFRAVVQRPFGSGLQDKIEEYEPGILSFVPVVVVRIRRDSGDPVTFGISMRRMAAPMASRYPRGSAEGLRGSEALFPASGVTCYES